MSTKNNNQVVLPFDLPQNGIKNYVAQHFNITFARQKNVGIVAKKIMTNVMAQIQRNDKEFLSYYQMHVSDVISENIEGESAYKQVKKAFSHLTDLKWLIEDLDGSKFAFRHLLNTSDARCGYDNGKITIVLNPLLKEYFIEMAHYTTYDLKWSMTFGSWYSMRLFEILSAYKDTGVWYVSISEYRKLMDCENKIPNVSDMTKITTEKALLELEKTNMAFTVESIFDLNHRGRGRKPVIALEFKLKKVQPKIKEIPNDWFSNPDHAKLLEKMKKRYQLSDVNIVKYSNLIGLSEVKKLLQSWDIKEASSEPIKNKLFYCNKVFVAMGKAAIELKKIK
jgi:plasmid replication initiation protein